MLLRLWVRQHLDRRCACDDEIVEVGEHWGYRARGIVPLVEVEVHRIGTQKPARVLVRFVSSDFEGREEWVPPVRLKVPWAEAPAFAEREARWDAVDTHPNLRNSPEEYGLDVVFREIIDEALASPAYRTPGVTQISDVAGLARFLQIKEELLRAESVSFEEDGRLIVPWATTELIVRHACQLNPDPILRYVDKEEDEAQQEATHGHTIRSNRRDTGWFITPEQSAAWDAEEPYGRATRDLLRDWCGTPAVERRDELKALREEVVRLDGLVTEAIRVLRDTGLKAKADDLERRFGIPLNDARNSRR